MGRGCSDLRKMQPILSVPSSAGPCLQLQAPDRLLDGQYRLSVPSSARPCLQPVLASAVALIVIPFSPLIGGILLARLKNKQESLYSTVLSVPSLAGPCLQLWQAGRAISMHRTFSPLLGGTLLATPNDRNVPVTSKTFSLLRGQEPLATKLLRRPVGCAIVLSVPSEASGPWQQPTARRPSTPPATFSSLSVGPCWQHRSLAGNQNIFYTFSPLRSGDLLATAGDVAALKNPWTFSSLSVGPCWQQLLPSCDRASYRTFRPLRSGNPHATR